MGHRAKRDRTIQRIVIQPQPKHKPVNRETLNLVGKLLQPWRPLPAHWRATACNEAGSVLLESSLPSASEHRSYLFQRPHNFLTANTPGEMPALFDSIESHLAAGRWVAGWFSYETGSHFLDLPGRAVSSPLAMLAVYDAPELFDHRGPGEAQQTPTPLNIAPMPTTDLQSYTAAIQQIKEWIAAGETYQLNYTTQLQTPCPHPPLAVYEALSAQQPSSYSAVVNFPNHSTILSFSPELFFRVDRQGTITTMPMKGTAPRGNTAAEDEQRAHALRHDEKNCAEHVMIVDLLRNDLNRICRTGTVCADDLFHVESYETLHQMTSRVSGALRPGTPWYEVFRALFPGGSITGAPKRNTAKLIQKIETKARGIYTGAIGYFAPDRTATFNIAIRTAVLQKPDSNPRGCHPERSVAKSKDLHSYPSVTLERKTSTLALGQSENLAPTAEPRHPEQSEPIPDSCHPQQSEPIPGSCHPERSVAKSKARPEPVEGDLHSHPSVTPNRRTATLTLGVGGGIVADSLAASEYNEALLKASFAQRASQPLQLIETMRAEAGIIPFLEAHLQRLASSAEALGFACNTSSIRSKLASINATGRVRLQLHRNGETEIVTSDAPTWPAALHLVLSDKRTEASLPHLRHKTTFRPEYNTPIPAGFHDTLFQNTHGEVTESCIANLLIQVKDRWLTPPLASGVLPGVMRAHLLHTNQIEEQIITLDHLKQATAAALCNALRGIAPIASLQLAGGERIHWASPSTLPKQ